jgi:hypothetical protein
MGKKCSKCGSTMKIGAKRTVGSNSISLAEFWIPIEDKKNKSFLGIKYSSQKQQPISTYACTSCGSLESYIEPKK